MEFTWPWCHCFSRILKRSQDHINCIWTIFPWLFLACAMQIFWSGACRQLSSWVRILYGNFLDIRCKLTKTWGSSIWIPGQYTNVPADIFLCIFVKVQGVFFLNFIGLTKFSMINWCACLTKKNLKIAIWPWQWEKNNEKIIDREITFSDNQAPVS